jgi:hypothetical protein
VRRRGAPRPACNPSDGLTVFVSLLKSGPLPYWVTCGLPPHRHRALRVQVEPLGNSAAPEDFREQPAVNVVAGREVIFFTTDVRRRPEAIGIQLGRSVDGRSGWPR